MLDDQGERVVTTRRRYEDSKGRLKALHDRRIGDKTFRTVWNKKNKDDEGTVEKICSGEEEAFESLWKGTPFGKAADKKAIEQEK